MISAPSLRAGRGTAWRTDGLRVLSVPAGHRYVAHLSDPDEPVAPGEVVVLPDPVEPGRAPGVWWPALALRAEWIARHGAAADLVHAHFGFESRTPAELTAWVRALRERALPLVLTVHDLTNPHLHDQDSHLARLDVLVPAADAVLTLTRGAAQEIQRRWGRPAQVVPHPHMAPLPLVGTPRPARGAGPARVGVHLKSLRANVDALGVLPALSRACAAVPGSQLVVHVHEEALDPGFTRHDPDLVRLLDDLERTGAAQVHRIAPLDDQGLWRYLRSLDVSVLPYRWATHSGWLEECRDLGTPVLAPDVGYLAEQGAVLGYRRGADGPDPDDLRRAVARVVAGDLGPAGRQETQERRSAQRRLVARAHHTVYRHVVRRTQ